MKNSISLFLIIKETSDVVLSRRAKGEKYQGLLQSFVHGRVDENETDKDAIFRESQEEANFDVSLVENLKKIDLELSIKGKDLCNYYIGYISGKDFLTLKAGEEVDSFLLINKNNVNEIKKKSEFNGSYFDENVMFDDELEALKKLS